MTENIIKIIKNEQWSIRLLCNKISNKELIKPKYQRKKKWDVMPVKSKNPNEREYITFLFKNQNSVHAITFGDNNSRTYTNIDGNNRINAICHFMDKPFELFPEYLEDLNAFIIQNFWEKHIQDMIKGIFSKLSYNEIIDMKFNRFFSDNYKDIYDKYLKPLRDEFEIIIECIQDKLKLDNKDHFDTNVKINVNLFQGYNTDELCKIFEDINKYNCNLTENELLACKLYSVSNFAITDNIIRIAIKDELVKMYTTKSEGEKLSCYLFDVDDIMNAYDFMCGFQNYAHTKCDLIPPFDYKDGLSLICKVYRLLYKGIYEDIFTTENVNQFISLMHRVIDILENVKQDIYTDKLNGNFEACDRKLYSLKDDKKLYSLKKNNTFIIIASILGYIKKNEAQNNIRKSIVKCILYHLFVQELSDKDVKDHFKKMDSISYEAGGTYAERSAEELYDNPALISQKISERIMLDILHRLCEQENKPAEKLAQQNKKDKRRNRKYFEKTLMYYYYKQKVPINLLSNNFWIEHICPFSSSWEKSIDIDRLGNIVPIIDNLNKKRSTKHISEYTAYDTQGFVRYIQDLLPTYNAYDLIVCHQNRKPDIYDIDKYIKMCDNNESIYVTNFVTCLYS